MNLEGKVLGNRYEIIEKIGNGGMATVYKARCRVLNRYVAVKILRDEFTTDNEFIKRFNIEAQSAASLTHPNIVSVYDVGHEGNLYYIVMELVKGKTLKEVIVEDGRLGWKWSAKVAIQIASALEMAHRNNLIHRDIKPHNIIITEDGTAKVTDFGIAKAVSNSTITAFGATIGSVHYFSPEQAKGGITDAKTDLYSLGVVLYEMVTGRVPFDADTPVSVALKHMQEEPEEPIKLNPGIPMSINRIIVKAMQKDPNLRYSSATEMKKDLEQALKDPEAVTGVIADTFATKRIDLNEINEKAEKNGSKHSKEKPEGKLAKIKKFLDEHKLIKVLLIVFSLFLAFIASMLITFFILQSGKTKNIQVPDLVGITLDEAKEKIKETKLKIEVEEERYDLEVEEGKIISQNPPYQESYSIKENSTIKLTISKGQELVVVPKVIGKLQDDATKELKDLGFVVQFEEAFNDEVEKGYVVKQDVAENEEILAGSTITLTVSSGIEQIEVPNLIGKNESDAKYAIEQAKLKWKMTSKTNDPSKPNGVVTDQTITAGSVVDKNTEISITVNEFEETKTATIKVNVKSLRGYVPKYEEDEDGNSALTNPPEQVSLKITVGSDTVYNQKVSENNENVTKEITGIGTTAVKVYINEVLVKQELQFNFNNTTEWVVE